MYVLGELPFETGGGGFLDFLGDFGVVCGVGDALAVGVLLCCGHFGLSCKGEVGLIWDRCGMYNRGVEMFLCEISGLEIY